MDLVFKNTSIGLYSTGAFRVMNEHHEHPFLFKNKTVHPFYIDCARLQNSTFYWRYVTNNLTHLVEQNNSITRISGGESRDLPFSIPVALNVGLPHVLLRKETKTYGINASIAGTINPEDNVGHVADLLQAGTSARKWVSCVESFGAKVLSYFVVFDRLQGGRENLERLGIGVYSLAEMNDGFFRIGINEGPVSNDLYAQIGDYLLGPRDWGLEYLQSHPEEIAHFLKSDGPGILSRGYSEHMKQLFELARPHLNKESIEFLIGEEQKEPVPNQDFISLVRANYLPSYR